MIDTDIFQVLTLALLFLILIALLAALATLSGIKKSMSDRAPAADSSAYTTPATGYAEPQTPSYGESPSPGYGAYTGGAYETAQPGGSRPAAQEVATGYVPVSEAAASQPATQQTSAAALTGTEPEEQPFERDGRWWFKRGDELLVYDEGTGQWVASGAAAPPAGAPASAGAASFTPAGGDAGEGWRCASCGAINGSTATVCRMCFTPR